MSENPSEIAVKIDFLHDARPYISSGEYANIVVSFPRGALPSRGDIVQIAGIERPRGAFFVSHRVFEAREDSLYAVTLVLGVEGIHNRT